MPDSLDVVFSFSPDRKALPCPVRTAPTAFNLPFATEGAESKEQRQQQEKKRGEETRNRFDAKIGLGAAGQRGQEKPAWRQARKRRPPLPCLTFRTTASSNQHPHDFPCLLSLSLSCSITPPPSPFFCLPPRATGAESEPTSTERNSRVTRASHASTPPPFPVVSHVASRAYVKYVK